MSSASKLAETEDAFVCLLNSLLSSAARGGRGSDIEKELFSLGKGFMAWRHPEIDSVTGLTAEERRYASRVQPSHLARRAIPESIQRRMSAALPVRRPASPEREALDLAEQIADERRSISALLLRENNRLLRGGFGYLIVEGRNAIAWESQVSLDGLIAVRKRLQDAVSCADCAFAAGY